MTNEEAVRKAMEYVRAAALEVGAVVDVRYVDLRHLDEKAKGCPSEFLETYNSVRKSFRNQWIVLFQRNKVPGQVSCPETHLVCVWDTGEVALFSSS
ncbi:MAG: hypothetical protein JO112_13745 [Planctomycetes bacterium]|nr:hypothetical protein [Planctomycetota bacterium]